MKKVITLVLALALILGLAVSASAATVVNETGHAYQAYQIFSGTQNAYDANLAAAKWGTGVNGAALLTALKNDSEVGAYFAEVGEGDAAVQHVIDVLSNKVTPPPSWVIGKFAQLAFNNRTTTATDIAADAASVDLAAGYYLIVDVTTLEEGDAFNPALLQVTNAGPITIAKKYDVPEPDKYVIADDQGDTTDHVKMEDTPIGKEVEFHIKAELPSNMYGYRDYTVKFHDSMTEGLTINKNSMEIWVGGKLVPVEKYEDYNITIEHIAHPTADTCDKDEEGKLCDFHVTIPNVMAIEGYVPGCEVIVKYKALVNDNALSIEYNYFRFEYDRDPNNEGDNPVTGIFPWEEAKTLYTYVDIHKIDGSNDQPLTGAEFTLTGVSNQKVKVTKKEFKAYEADATVNESNKYWKLTDGSYTTQDPAAPETDPSAYVAPDEGGKYTLYYAEEYSAWETLTGENVTVTAVVGADGTVKFDGLGEGVYTIKETKAPAGYNGLQEDITVTIVFHEASGTWDVTSNNGSGNTIVVENFKGSVLPETGGVGTTMFYIFGGLLFASAAVMLITKKRMIAA